jgi:hypothetical protein
MSHMTALVDMFQPFYTRNTDWKILTWNSRTEKVALPCRDVLSPRSCRTCILQLKPSASKGLKEFQLNGMAYSTLQFSLLADEIEIPD